MLKELIQKTFLLGAILIITVFSVSCLWAGATQEIILVFELFLLAFFIVLIQLLLKTIVFRHFLLSIIAEYFSVSGFVLLYGCFVQWFEKSNWHMAFLYVAVVYLPAYFLDMAIVKREINYINVKLEGRRKIEHTKKS
ncbi:MAG: hypothetical protein K2O16_02610 [Lachnospiraceae bacterium]|nr:hypothetical protein [Lachnospiraceae bacterium]MDE7331119.1 hypothetical protein [Lachnospiraceae bacterium]